MFSLFRFLLLLTDILTWFIAFLIAFLIRSHPSVVSMFNLKPWPLNPYLYLKMFPVVTLYILLGFLIFDLYQNRKPLFMPLEISRIVKALLFALGLWLATLFFTYSHYYSRFVIGLSFFLGVFFMWIGRYLLFHLNPYLVSNFNMDISRILIHGTGRYGRQLGEFLAVIGKERGFNVIGYTGKAEDPSSLPYELLSEDIYEATEKYKPDEVFIAQDEWKIKDMVELVSNLNQNRIIVRVFSREFTFVINKIGSRIDFLGGVPIVTFIGRLRSKFYIRIKRVLDIIVSSIILAVSFPFLAIIALLIKITSEGSILFRQQRMKNERETFEFMKLRSMYKDADKIIDELHDMNEKQNQIFKIKNDPRITPLGRFLRRFSIDEFPQFYHVICGQMTLVGPRPPLPEEVDKYEDWHKVRLQGMMGITGLWQISGRSDLDFNQMVALDYYYIANPSFWLDLHIIFNTFFAVLFCKGAY
ncbi:MAG: sugar transferase [Candidatus Coatesbacteria bacterium]|nr:sugar transferase [Candidatus Coatesbacteria bacterium]